MSGSVLGNIGDIVLTGKDAGAVGQNSANVKKNAESPEKKKYGPYDYGPENAGQVQGTEQQDGYASESEALEKPRPRFREVLEKRIGEESGSKSKDVQDNTDAVNGVNEKGTPSKTGFSADAAVLSSAVVAGEKGGVKTAAKGGISKVDLTENKQKRSTNQGQSGQKEGQLHKVQAGAKMVEGNAPEKGPLRTANQSEIANQKQLKAGQDQVPAVNDADKEKGLGIKSRTANGANEVNADLKVVSDKTKPAQNMITRQVSEEGKMPGSNKELTPEPLKLRAEHTVRVGNDEQNKTPPMPLRAELKLRTAGKTNAKQGPIDAVQNQQKTLDGADVVETSQFKAQIENVVTANGLNQNNDGATGINAVTARSQTMGDSVEAPIGGVKNVGQQIIDNVAANIRGVDKEIRIMLNPPDLGRVRIQFQQRSEEIVGWLQVEKAQTRYDVERQIPQIVAGLQQNGVSSSGLR